MSDEIPVEKLADFLKSVLEAMTDYGRQHPDLYTRGLAEVIHRAVYPDSKVRCPHERIHKEYLLGMDTGDKVCASCKTVFTNWDLGLFRPK